MWPSCGRVSSASLIVPEASECVLGRWCSLSTNAEAHVTNERQQSRPFGGPRCAYGLASKPFSSLQLVATKKATLCRPFQFLAVCCNSLEGTLNPKIAGSSPTGPLEKPGKRDVRVVDGVLRLLEKRARLLVRGPVTLTPEGREACLCYLGGEQISG